jgi:Tol biopolymer transport system component/predicted Ser/Thr protein kinase
MIAGTVLGHYRIIEPLGHGGMGEVYLAEDTKLHRRVALKTLPAAFASDPDRRRRFEREAQAIAALNHPGIVTIYSVEVEGPTPFITMEYVEGRPLRQTIPAGGAPVEVLLKTGIGIADAVAAAHQRGIVHRDLKPANVMIGPDGRVKVLDFGLAKVRETEPAFTGDASTHMVEEDLTGGGRIVGTVAYMSPEQAEGKPVDQRSDIFSLGVVLHEMATGERPFKGDTEISVISAIIKDTPNAVTDSRPDLPLPFARIVKRCLVKDPQRRYQSARDLQNDLEDLKQDVDSGVMSSPSGALPPPAAPARRRLPRSVIFAGAAGLLLAVAAGAWWTFTHSRPEARTFVPDRFTRLTDAGTASLATISPDGRYVVHVKLENRLPGLWVRQTGTTSDVRILPPADVRIKGLAFSPDGDFVFYATYPGRSGVATLYKVPVLGGPALRVLEDVDSAASFSPDGRRFSFLRGRPAENVMMLMVAGVDGTDVRQVAAPAQPNGLDSDAAPWSPDGSTIMATGHFSTKGVVRSQLVAVDASSGRVTPFGGEWSYINGTAWMPDGRSVLVAAIEKETEQSPQVWQVRWPGGERVRLTSGVNGYEGISVSADGRTISTIEGERHSNIWLYPMAGGAGRQITSVARGNPGGGGLAWTPSGRIVYGMQPASDAPNQLFIMDADGSHSTQLTNLRNFAALPSVSADGKWLYFNGGPNTSTIWRMPLAGGDPEQLTHGLSDFQPLVSSDSKWIYYTANDDGRNQAMKLPADGGAPVALTPPELGFGAAAVSASGTELYGIAWSAAARGSRFAAVATSGRAVRFIENAPPRGQLTPDGTAWVIADVRDKVAGLFIKPIGGGPERRIGDLGDDRSWRVAPSPDGRDLAVVRGRSTSDVVLIRAK